MCKRELTIYGNAVDSAAVRVCNVRGQHAAT